MLLRQHLFFYNATSDTILTMFVFCTVFGGDWGDSLERRGKSC